MVGFRASDVFTKFGNYSRFSQTTRRKNGIGKAGHNWSDSVRAIVISLELGSSRRHNNLTDASLNHCYGMDTYGEAIGDAAKVTLKIAELPFRGDRAHDGAQYR